MSRDLSSLASVFSPYEAAQLLLAETGLSDISHTLFAGTSGLAVQALVTGSVLQLVHRYFRRQARLSVRAASGAPGSAQDPPLARAGVIWLTALICLHVIVVYVTNARVLLMSQQFTAGYLMDYFLAQVSNLIFTVVALPIFIFFAFRAWNLWSRRRVVMLICLSAVTPAVILGLVAAGYGLQHPYPLDQIDNSAFAAWLPFVEELIKKQQWMTLASSAAQFLAACVFSGLICAGLWSHRNCCATMPGWSNKIAFATGESLFPLVITSAGILAGDLLTKLSAGPIGPLISRAVHSCAPAIYFHCLMNSLTCAQRQRDSLRSSMSLHHGNGLEFPHGGKGDLIDDGNDHTFNPHFHPGDLDTPHEIKSTIFPFTFFNSFDKSDGTTETFTSKVNSAIRNVFGKGAGTTEDADHYTVRTAGSGRRSSLARACSYTSNKATDLKAMTGLSFKMQPKKGLPIMSYKPPMGRRESESIFVAHEEFEGLPQFPGDRELKVSTKGSQLSLGDIEEGGSDSALTPRFYTPPRMASPAFASEWEQDNQTLARGRVDFGRSPESAYEPTVVGA